MFNSYEGSEIASMDLLHLEEASMLILKLLVIIEKLTSQLVLVNGKQRDIALVIVQVKT